MRSADVQYVASKRHFAELLERYSYPICCVNLTKAENARECVVSDQYDYVVNEVINRELPEKLHITYKHFDMKKRKKEPIFPRSLHELVKPYVKKMGIFLCKREKSNDEMNQIYI
jgi:SacI homology domain